MTSPKTLTTARRSTTFGSLVESELSKINKQFKAAIRFKPCSDDNLGHRDTCIAQSNELEAELRMLTKDLMENAADPTELDAQLPPLLVPLQDNVKAAEELKLKNKKDRENLQKEKRKASKDKDGLDKRQNQRKQRCTEEMEKFTKRFNAASAFEPCSLYYKILKDELIMNQELTLKDYEENTEHLLMQTIDDNEFEAQLYQQLQELEESATGAEDCEEKNREAREKLGAYRLTMPMTSNKRKASQVQIDDFNSVFDDMERRIKKTLNFHATTHQFNQLVSNTRTLVANDVGIYRLTMQNLAINQASEKDFVDKLKECVDSLDKHLIWATGAAYFNNFLKDLVASAEDAFTRITERFDEAEFLPCTELIKEQLEQLAQNFAPVRWQKNLEKTLTIDYETICNEDKHEEAEESLKKELEKRCTELNEVVNQIEALGSVNETEKAKRHAWKWEVKQEFDSMKRQFEKCNDYFCYDNEQVSKMASLLDESLEAINAFRHRYTDLLWTAADEKDFKSHIRNSFDNYREIIAKASALKVKYESRVRDRPFNPRGSLWN